MSDAIKGSLSYGWDECLGSKCVNSESILHSPESYLMLKILKMGHTPIIHPSYVCTLLAHPRACDLSSSSRHDGVKGTRQKALADITLSFNQMTWIPDNEPPAAFDYNKNGRIDFADITWLFNHL